MTDNGQGVELKPVRKVLAIADGPHDAASLATAAEFAARHDAAPAVLACVAPPLDMRRLSRLTGLAPAAMVERVV